MSLKENITTAIAGHNAMAVALSQIAAGRPDGGRPLSGEAARQIARTVLTDLGMDWTHVLKVHDDMRDAFSKLPKLRK